MTLQVSPEEKLKFSSILFKEQPPFNNDLQVLRSQEKSKLKSIYAQKIVYNTANSHIHPPPDYSGVQPTDQPQQTGCIATVCCCFYPQTYRKSFDITTDIFRHRLKNTIMVWKNDFIEYEEEKPQLYGPLWVTLTYTIVLSLAANINQSIQSMANQQILKKQILLKGLLIVAIFQIALPFIYACIIKCMQGRPISNIQSAMLTGYSILLYIIPTALCFIPSLYWHVGMLAVAGAVRGIFLFRNLSARLQSKVCVMAVVILILEVLYFFTIIRVMFAQTRSNTLEEGAKKAFHELTLRHFNL